MLQLRETIIIESSDVQIPHQETERFQVPLSPKMVDQHGYLQCHVGII